MERYTDGTTIWQIYLHDIRSVACEINRDYAKVYSGRDTDSDYFGNHRTILFSRSENAANKGEAPLTFLRVLGIPITFVMSNSRLLPS